MGNSRCGYNNDFLSFIETGDNEGYLAINFEYISALPWIQSYQKVIGESLPFEEVQQALSKEGINAFNLPDDDQFKAKIEQISQAALTDQGIGVISLKRNSEGKWERTNSPADRRIYGISGLKDGRYLPKFRAKPLTRTHQCPYCQTVLDRDHNAAINILNKGWGDDRAHLKVPQGMRKHTLEESWCLCQGGEIPSAKPSR
ncbi:MAG: transposase [Symploca sp. SIO1C4]|uniref:Transposase n=1 Tax=Symploca sp. SIO1C4 TaxID=2607765 RepID=A0A6B3N760_9CYAN|nr:transposase [Symploca sp. SIO1C4]